jgi:hypothetical protein
MPDRPRSRDHVSGYVGGYVWFVGLVLARVESPGTPRKARTMTDTKTWSDEWIDQPCAPAPAADEAARPASSARHDGRLTGRLGARLRALLHAPALLAGRPGDPRDPAVIEDDRERLAGPRGW